MRAAVIDGTVDPSERRKLKALLQERFELDGDEVRPLLEEAAAREHDSVDLYRFTSVLARQLDQDGRKRIVEMLWEVVLADGVVHDYEASLMRRVPALLYVSDRENAEARARATERLAQAPSSGGPWG